MLITDIAFKIANFIMFQKIANCLSIISFVMVASMSGGAYFGYKYVTSEQFKVANAKYEQLVELVKEEEGVEQSATEVVE